MRLIGFNIISTALFLIAFIHAYTPTYMWHILRQSKFINFVSTFSSLDIRYSAELYVVLFFRLLNEYVIFIFSLRKLLYYFIRIIGNNKCGNDVCQNSCSEEKLQAQPKLILTIVESILKYSAILRNTAELSVNIRFV